MLERLRERVELFLEAVARDRCRFELEDRSSVQLGARYAGAADLFGQDRIREVQRALAGASGTEEKQLRFLLHFLATGRSRCVAAGEVDRLQTWLAHVSVPVRDRSVTLRSIPSLLHRTGDRALRGDLQEALLSALDEQLQLLEGLATRQRDAVEELGYGSFVESWEVLSGIDLRGLAREAERFLADTEPLLRELLPWYLPRLAGVEPAEATESDMPRLEEAEPYASYFADRRLLARAQEALRAAGLDPTAEGRLRTVIRDNFPTGTGAVCCAFRVPDEVVLTVSEQPGRPVQAALLGALGYGLHRAYTAADLPVEFRRLGDRSVPEGFARTLADLLSNRPFLGRVFGMPGARQADYLRLSVLLDLLRIRRDAALLQLEVTTHSQPDARETPHRYAELLGQATGLRHDPRGAGAVLCRPFRGATALRAEQFAAVLSHHLRGRFDEDWWRNPRSGALLRDLFHSGQCYTAAEVSVQLESQPLSLGRVRESLEERL